MVILFAYLILWKKNTWLVLTPIPLEFTADMVISYGTPASMQYI